MGPQQADDVKWEPGRRGRLRPEMTANAENISHWDIGTWNTNRHRVSQAMPAVRERPHVVALQEVIPRGNCDFIQQSGYTIIFSKSSGLEPRSALAVRADRLMTIYNVLATANNVQCMGGVGESSWSVMSVYTPHERSKRAAQGLGEFVSVIGKAGTARRSYRMAGDLNWYGLREW